METIFNTAPEAEISARRKKNNGSFLNHAGATVCQMSELRQYPAPLGIMGSKYEPYEHHLFVADVIDQVEKVLGPNVIWSKEFSVKDGRYYPTRNEPVLDELGNHVLNKKGLIVTRAVRDQDQEPLPIPGEQMFGLLKLDLGDIYEGDHIVPSLGLRNSLGGTLAAGVMYGNNCFVCDNQVFSGENVFSHKHTKNACVALIVAIREMVKKVPRLFKLDQEFRHILKTTPMDSDTSFGIVGKMLGNKLMNITQAMMAVQEVREPSFKEFEDPTAWSTFNHITFAKKRANPRDSMMELEKINAFFREKVLGDLWGACVDRVDDRDRAVRAAYVGGAITTLGDDLAAAEGVELDDAEVVEELSELDQAVVDAEDEGDRQYHARNEDDDFVGVIFYDDLDEDEPIAEDKLLDPGLHVEDLDDGFVDPNEAFTGGYSDEDLK